jgi:hypothetical protein
MTNRIKEQLETAGRFFIPKPTGLAVAPQTPEMFQPNKNSTGAVMQFNGELPDDVTAAQRAAFAALLKDQQFYLQSGLGLVTAWMTDKYQRVPKEWGNSKNWQEPLSYVPSEFYTPVAITEYHYQEHIKGIEVATSFLETMIAWASGAGVVASFGSFLQTLGDQISAGIASKETEMYTYNLSFSYRPVKNAAGEWELMSTADYYFISFTESEKTVYSSCASAETFDFDFKYESGSLFLNWASMSNPINADARKSWDGTIAQATVDDVTKAKNFFGSKVKSAS